jgi:hypothetical protein
MSVKRIELMHKCGCRTIASIQSGRASKAIKYASQTRCLNCFNTKSLLPKIRFQVGDRVRVKPAAFGEGNHKQFAECIVTRISICGWLVLVRLLDRNYLINNLNLEQLVDIKYVSFAR